MPEGLNPTAALDELDNAYKIKTMQKKFRDSFSGAELDPKKWRSTVGAGGSVAVAAGVLTMASGTTANAETSVITEEVFTIPFRASIGLTLSQRIINQQFFVEAVSVDPATLQPDGRHCVALRFDGATATTAIYEVQNGGLARLASTASTFPTTVSGGLYELEAFSDEAWFHGGALDSTNARTNSYRRHQQIPDPNGLYKVRLRWLNGGTPPASTTSALIQFITVQDYMELTAEITAGRGQSVAGQAVGVTVAGSLPAGTAAIGALAAGAAAIGTVGSTAPATPYILNSAASTNANLVLAGTSGLHAFFASNQGASDAWVKLYNKATAPVPGTDTPAMVIRVPANGQVELSPGFAGYRFALGLGLAITGGAADADTTAVAAGQVKVILSRTV